MKLKCETVGIKRYCKFLLLCSFYIYTVRLAKQRSYLINVTTMWSYLIMSLLYQTYMQEHCGRREVMLG